MNRPAIIAAAIVALLVVGGIAYYAWDRDGADGAPPAPGPDAAAPPADADAEAVRRPPVDLPELAESDAAVRELADGLSPHPLYDAVLGSEHLVRRFVAAVDNLSRGESPRPHLRMLAPDEDFDVTERDGETYVAESSFRRYDAATELLVSVDADRAVELYEQLGPLFDAAYAELGAPLGSFDAAMAAAVGHLVEFEVPQGPYEVERHINRWEYVDPALDSLSPARKHLMRLGPDNARRVQAKLRRVDALLRG